MTLLRAIAAMLSLLALSTPAIAQSPATLAGAIAAFNDFDDAKAKATLDRVIAASPTGLDAAKAHVYLGLIAVNALDSNRARAEFVRALAIEPTVEVPYEASPKARLVFEQAQKQFSRESSQPVDAAHPVRLQTQQVPLVVENGPAPAVATHKAEAPPHSHVPAYVVGALGLAVFGAGVGFGVWQSSTLKIADVGQLTSAQTQAGTQGLVADICFGVGGALAVTSVVLFLTELGGGSDEVSLRLSATPGGATAALSF